MLGLKYLYKTYTTKSLAIQRTCDRGQELVNKLKISRGEKRKLWRCEFSYPKATFIHKVKEVQLSEMDSLSLVLRPVRAIRVTRGGLEPSAIGEFSRQTWQVKSHPKSPRTTGNEAGTVLYLHVLTDQQQRFTTRFQFYTRGTAQYTLDTFFQKAHSFSLNFTTT